MLRKKWYYSGANQVPPVTLSVKTVAVNLKKLLRTVFGRICGTFELTWYQRQKSIFNNRLCHGTIGNTLFELLLFLKGRIEREFLEYI